ncbi:MAG: hypothetical protein OXR66_02630 [Candidatus Woesearchaeota archaeon]|nr:hypothetical protein [Candidatus Woesearchaeota archaeon]
MHNVPRHIFVYIAPAAKEAEDLETAFTHITAAAREMNFRSTGIRLVRYDPALKRPRNRSSDRPSNRIEKLEWQLRFGPYSGFKRMYSKPPSTFTTGKTWSTGRVVEMCEFDPVQPVGNDYITNAGVVSSTRIALQALRGFGLQGKEAEIFLLGNERFASNIITGFGRFFTKDSSYHNRPKLYDSGTLAQFNTAEKISRISRP